MNAIKELDPNHRQYLLYLRDVFGSSFELDVIESVLVQSNWNVDKAVDDLMSMSYTNVQENVFDNTLKSEYQHEPILSSEIEEGSTEFNDENNDGLIVLEEEEYSLPSGSNTESEETPDEERDKNEVFSGNATNATTPTISYAAAAQKPSSEKAMNQKPPILLSSGYVSYDRIKRTRDSVERVKLCVQGGFKIMVILRGVSGSGKTTLARSILQDCGITENEFHFIHSTDNYFHLNRHGIYKYEKEKLEEAHRWNEVNVLHVVREGLTPVIIDNTNVEMWNMKAYVGMAVYAGYEIEVIEPATHWFFHAPTLAKKNRHNVSEEQIRKRLQIYDHKVSGSVLLKTFNLDYAPDQTPPKLGVRMLKNAEVIQTLDSVYCAVYKIPNLKPKGQNNEQKRKMKKERKTTRNQRKKKNRKLREMKEKIEKEKGTAKGCVEIDQLSETDSADSVIDTDDFDAILPEESDTLDEEINSDDDETESDDEDLSDDSSDEESVDDTSATSEEIESNSGSTTLNSVDEEVAGVGCVRDKFSDDDGGSEFKHSAVDDLSRSINPEMDEVELESANKVSNQLRNALTSNSNVRLSCFKNMNETNENDTETRVKNKHRDNGDDAKTPTTLKFEFTNQAVNKDSFMKNSKPRDLTAFCDFMTSPLLSSKRNDLASPKSSTSNQDSQSAHENAISVERMPKVSNNDSAPATSNFFSNTSDESAGDNKFKTDSNEISKSLIQNVIANDLWGTSDTTSSRNKMTNDDLIEEDLSDDSENSDSRSKSSCSEKVVITDIHNTSTRFVNNNIKSDPSTERKKPNKNRDKNENVQVCELNTTKGSNLISEENKDTRSDNAEFSSSLTQRNDRKSNVPERKISLGFQVIENKLRNEGEESTDGNYRAEESDEVESKYLNQWMRGEGRDESKNADDKRKDVDSKPQRRVRDSPSKQKNTETASIRLVNDIRSPSASPKTTSVPDKNTNQESAQSIKSTNVNRSSSRVNTMTSTVSKEESIESDFESKSRGFRYSEERDNVNTLNSSFSNYYRNLDNDGCVWSPASSENVTSSWNTNENCNKNINPFDAKLPQKRAKNKNVSPVLLSESSWLLKDNSDDSNDARKPSPVPETSSKFGKIGKIEKPKTVGAADAKGNNYFLPVNILNLERNKWTNTGIDDPSAQVVQKIGRCREINVDSVGPDATCIRSSYKCDKSTMTEGSFYSVKAKPMRPDLENLFPAKKVDIILDLYEKCNGNMDWMLEVLMDDPDGFLPTEEQLEYLASLQNLVEHVENLIPLPPKEKVEKEKKSSKKRNKNRSGKNSRQNNKPLVARGQVNHLAQKNSRVHSPEDLSSPDEGTSGSSPESVPEEFVDLFLDWSTVSQLMERYGNPTIYTVQDYQPIVKLPETLAHQLHAYLIGSLIDQAEEQEDFINQLVEEEQNMTNQIRGAETVELTQKDVTEMENSLGNILNDPFYMPPGGINSCEGIPNYMKKDNRSENSFASKLSLNLLLRAFPTLDAVFVRNTFKSQNYNYYETKNILGQYGKEIPIDEAGDGCSSDKYNVECEDDIPLIENGSSNIISISEIAEKVNVYRMNAAANQRESQKYHENMRVAVQEKKFGIAAYYRDIMEAYKEKCTENNAQAAAVLVNSSCIENNHLIDLHYFKVADAVAALDKFLDHHILRMMGGSRSKMILYIVTGRGARSKDGISRLQPAVKNRLRRRNISFEIEPSNTGLVKATIRRNSLMSTDLEVNR